MSPRTRPSTDYEQGGGTTVVQLSFSVAELIKNQGKQDEKIDRVLEKIEELGETQRKQIDTLRTEIKNEFATKGDLAAMGKDVAGVRKDTDSNTSNMNKVAMLIIGAVITGVIGFFFAFAQH